MPEVECILEHQDMIGESPLWSLGEGALYWVDVTAPCIYRLVLATRHLTRWSMPEAVGSIAFRRSGGLVAGMRSGIYALDLESGRREALFRHGSDRPGLRFNDGKCDRAGRFWSGTMDDQAFEPLGGEVAQYDAAGHLIRTVPLPVRYPLMCSFGGPDIDILFVTTGRVLATPDELAAQPLNGSLFAVHGTGSIGIPEGEYGR